jgi:hypothetical protein
MSEVYFVFSGIPAKMRMATLFKMGTITQTPLSHLPMQQLPEDLGQSILQMLILKGFLVWIANTQQL